MAVTSPRQERPTDVIPVIDLGPCFEGAPGALEAAAAELRAALEGIGFFILVNHGVPRDLIDRTFAEARRFHAQPYETKMALRMNEHNNGYMAMGRYAVWTSEVNANDKPDLNEAFFVKRERPPDDPLRRSGRRFVGPNRWPDGLPGFREAVLAYTDCVTQEIRVPDSVFAQVRRHFDDRELVELTATVAGYNLVSRFLVAMQIDQERRSP